MDRLKLTPISENFMRLRSSVSALQEEWSSGSKLERSYADTLLSMIEHLDATQYMLMLLAARITEDVATEVLIPEEYRK